MKDIAGEKVGIVVSYLKGAVILLQKGTGFPIDLIGFLNDIMCLVENTDFTTFMRSVYFDHKKNTHVIDYAEYPNLAEAEYCTLYRRKKWMASKNDPDSGFFVESNAHGDAGYEHDNSIDCRGGRGTARQGRDGRGYGRGGRDDWD